MLYICGIESKTLNSMKAYKGFNKDLTCRGFQYEEGKTYEHDGEVKLCNEGFHACEDPLETLDYYDVATSEYHEVELDGVSEERGDDSKVVAKKITIGARLGIDKLVKACIDFRFARIEKMLPNTGDNGAASNTGDNGAASNTGDNGAASNTGYNGAASNTGYNGAAETFGKHSIAMSVGKNSKARGALGTWIVLAERGEWDGVGYPIKDIQAFRVDGEKVKADTWYMLMNGQLKECE